jgi:hypothetical protein
MKHCKIYKIGLLFLMLLMSNVVCAVCSDEAVLELFQQLQPSIPWLDINPQSVSYACNLTVRYYPCATPIDDLLIKAVQKIKSHCSILLGFHTKIEGYCAVKNVWFNC